MKFMKRFFIAQLFLFLALIHASAQRVQILTMEREGTAGVYLSENDKVAYIIDGGRKGGLSKPRLDGKPVLEALLADGYEELVISCSHPHDDHAGGLREIIESDPNMTKFKRITFVDSGYPVSESLREIFLRKHPDFPKDKVSFSSAEARNGFSGLSRENSGVKVSNFEYTPKPGASIHGHATIHHVVLERDAQKTLLVDFDDADDELLRIWADWAKQDPATRRPNVVVAPHHNADTVDITPLLDQRIRPDACIITANPKNRFLHPGPQNTVKWIDALGSDKIFITGVHDNISVTEKGITTANNQRSMEATLESILRPMRSTIEREKSEMEELAIGRPLSASEQKRYAELNKKQEAVSSLTDIFQGGNGSLGGGGGGGSLPPPRKPSPTGPLPSASSVGEFLKVKGQYEAALGQHVLPARSTLNIHPSAGSGAVARAARFATALEIFPVRGGIILGNSLHPDSGRVKKAKISVTNGVPVIDLVVEQGTKIEECRFDEMTMSEFWAAYNFVKPCSELREQFKIDENENGLAGKSGDLENEDGWRFAIHPAVAGTIIARDSMRLDMLIAAEESWLSDLKIPHFDTYQWYDDLAILSASNGLVRIKAASEPQNILLRIRLWTNALPVWSESYETLESDLMVESYKRVVKEAGDEDKFGNLSESQKEQLIDKVMEKLMSEMEAAGGGNVGFQPQKLLQRLDAGFDAFRRIERFARAVAVLHWIADTCPNGLPALPKDVQIKRYEIPSQLKMDEVRPARSTIK
jgi:hypothetical protein